MLDLNRCNGFPFLTFLSFFFFFWISKRTVTNFQSKRKTPSCVAFYKGERMFGSDASALMGRKPDSSFAKVYR